MVSTNPLWLIIPLALLVLVLPAAEGQAEPPTTAPVWSESCYWYGPPNITANPPEDKYGFVGFMSFDRSWGGGQPISFNITYNIDKLLPGGRAVTQLDPGGKTVTRNEDLCDFVRGGCPIHPGDFMVSFNLTIEHFTQIQFSIFTKAGELLQCVFFEV